jgi:hypothetical protein
MHYIYIESKVINLRKNRMSKIKNQLETLAARMNDGDITITDKLMGLVDKHNVSCWNARWSWTNNAGKNVAGGIGALAKFLSDGVDSLHRVNDVRLSSDANGKCWTTANGG